MSDIRRISVKIRPYSNQVYFHDTKKSYELKEWSIGESFDFSLKLVIKEKVFNNEDIVQVQFDGQFRMNYSLTFQVHDIDFRILDSIRRTGVFVYRLGPPIYNEESVVFI